MLNQSATGMNESLILSQRAHDLTMPPVQTSNSAVEISESDRGLKTAANGTRYNRKKSKQASMESIEKGRDDNAMFTQRPSHPMNGSRSVAGRRKRKGKKQSAEDWSR